MKLNMKKLWTASIILLLLLPVMSMPILATEKEVLFDLPSSVAIGDELSIAGIASIGTTVDIAIDGVVIPELNDVTLDETGSFNVVIDTAATYSPNCLKIPGSVKIEAFIDRTQGVGTIGPDEGNDGSTMILMVELGITAELSTNTLNRGDSFVINGAAPGSRQVEILTISPRGGEAGRYGIRANTGTEYSGITYDKVSVSDDLFSKEFHVSDTAYTGSYLVIVVSYGIDGVYGNTGKSNIIEAINQEYNNPNLGSITQYRILHLILEGIIESPISDDYAYIGGLAVVAPKSYAARLDPIEDVEIGESLVVTGTSNKKDGSEIVVTVKGPVDLSSEIVYVENGVFHATFDTSYLDTVYDVGTYTVVADDGEGNTDEAAVEIFPPVPTPAPTVSVTPTPTPTPSPSLTPISHTPVPSTPPTSPPQRDEILTLIGVICSVIIVIFGTGVGITVFKKIKTAKRAKITIERAIYDPCKHDFIERPLPRMKEWINHYDPSAYWLALSIQNNTNKTVKEWSVELKISTALKIEDAKIEGIEIEPTQEAHLGYFKISVPEEYGFTIPKRSAQRVYFKLRAEKPKTVYEIKGVFKSAVSGDVPIRQKEFKYLCDAGMSPEAVKAELKKAFSEKDAVKLALAFKTVQELDRMCDKEAKTEEYRDKLSVLKNYTEGFSDKFSKKVDEISRVMVKEQGEYLEEEYKEKVRRFCTNLVDIWISEFLKV